MGQCFCQIKAYSAAEKSCSQVLQVDPDNVKALFRKGKVGQNFVLFENFTINMNLWIFWSGIQGVLTGPK